MYLILSEVYPLVWWCIFVAGKENQSVEICKERITALVAVKFRKMSQGNHSLFVWDKKSSNETCLSVFILCHWDVKMADPLCNAGNGLLFLVMALFAKLLEKAWYELEILMAHFTLVASCNRKEY